MITVPTTTETVSQSSSTTTIPLGQIPTVSGRVKLQVDNPSTFIADDNSKAGFNKFMADYIGVTVNEIFSELSVLSGTRLRRLQDANVAADVTVNLPPERGVSKTAVTQKLEDLGDADSASLNAALANADAPGYNVAIDDVTDIQEGTVETTLPTTTVAPTPTVTDSGGEEGLAGSIIALIVILCIVFVVVVLAIVLFIFRRRKWETNNNTNEAGNNLVTNADNRGEIPEEQMDEHGENVEVRARHFQVNLPPAEDNAVDGPEAIRV